MALEKKSSDNPPLAIWYTLHPIATKCAVNFAIASLGNKLLSEQQNLGIPEGWETAVHTTRRFILNLPANFLVAV